MSNLKDLVQAHGGVTAFSRLIGVSPQVVSNWIKRGQVAVGNVLEVEKKTGASRYELRPDIFGPAPAEQGKAAA